MYEITNVVDGGDGELIVSYIQQTEAGPQEWRSTVSSGPLFEAALEWLARP